MAHTKEQRDHAGLCNARKRNGEHCRAFAGQGTNHPGVGPCKHHLGNTAPHEKRAIALNLKRQMVTYGEPVEDVSALNALLQELAAAVGHTAWLRARISDLSQDELGTTYGVALVRLYDSERDRKARMARLAIESGVDEAKIRVMEGQVRMLGEALARACDLAGLSEPVKRKVGAFLRNELAQAQAQPQAALTA